MASKRGANTKPIFREREASAVVEHDAEVVAARARVQSSIDGTDRADREAWRFPMRVLDEGEGCPRTVPDSRTAAHGVAREPRAHADIERDASGRLGFVSVSVTTSACWLATNPRCRGVRVARERGVTSWAATSLGLTDKSCATAFERGAVAYGCY